eukprot:CAMPEP_0118931226 /NCGR_PEP_ID=MMETSP1169-20130426/7637_1 /TAXON_ID=36882 /ORGANISM="Pyramimonas obovata, Strain CCMP722" /LENGTH=673 /DNA_ID=CAMNT_0006873703 /DNA_START=46 /DNA_END=2067 /DNA_ORIENTATION=+
MAAQMATSAGLTCTAAKAPSSNRATRLTARSAYGPRSSKLVCGKTSACTTSKEVCVCHLNKSSVWMRRTPRSLGIASGIDAARTTRSATARAGVAEVEGKEEEIKDEMNKNVTVAEVADQVAMLTELHPDTKLGTYVHFSGGARGILLWRREPLTFCVILEEAKVEKGEKVTCDLNERAGLLVNETSWGSVVGPFVGLSVCDKKPDAKEVVHLINDPPDVPSRFPIDSNMHTGFTAADAFTPVGRGQSMMIESEFAEARTKLGINAVLAQKDTDVRCVYAFTGRDGTQSSTSSQALLRLRADQNVANAPCIVATKEKASAVERYLAACAACSIAEGVRDTGGSSLVVLDDLSCLADMWEVMSSMWHGFMDNEWKQQSIEMAAELEEGEEEQRPMPGSAEEMVDFGGTLVPVEVAERRSFFSAFLQRAARMNGGCDNGSLTILGIVGGRPADSMHGGSGAESVSYGKSSPEAIVAQYTTLSEEQKEKMLAALRAKAAAAEGEAAPARAADVAALPTPIVEEFNSISDGHINLQMSSEGKVVMNLRSSVSRVGNPAAAAAMRRLRTAEVRLQVMQADDETEYSASAETSDLTRKLADQAKSVKALLETDCAAPVLLGEQAVALYALLKAKCAFEQVEPLLAEVRAKHPTILEEVETSGNLNYELEAQLDEIIKAL